jgi:hypothetical protein
MEGFAGHVRTLCPVGIAVGGIGKAVHSAAQEEQSIIRLSQALKNQGIAFDEVGEKIEETVAILQEKTAVGDTEQRESLATLIEMTGDLNEALELHQLALDVAAAKQMDLNSAAELVGRVARGNTGILSRYGIVLEEGADATKALAAMSKMFGGQAEAMANTTAGAWKKIQNSMDDVMEEIGSAILPVLLPVLQEISDVIKQIDFDKISATIVQIVKPLAKIAEELAPLLADLFADALELTADVIEPLAETFLPNNKRSVARDYKPASGYPRLAY